MVAVKNASKITTALLTEVMAILAMLGAVNLIQNQSGFDVVRHLSIVTTVKVVLMGFAPLLLCARSTASVDQELVASIGGAKSVPLKCWLREKCVRLKLPW